jgi:hypothetical protein
MEETMFELKGSSKTDVKNDESGRIAKNHRFHPT